MAFASQFEDSEQTPLGDRGRRLFRFQCELELSDDRNPNLPQCPHREQDSGCNAAIVLEASEQSPSIAEIPARALTILLAQSRLIYSKYLPG